MSAGRKLPGIAGSAWKSPVHGDVQWGSAAQGRLEPGEDGCWRSGRNSRVGQKADGKA